MEAFHEAMSLRVIQEAQIALSRVHRLPVTQTCDAQRWIVVNGTVLIVSDVQPVLVPQGVLLTVTADINTPDGVQVLPFIPIVALVQGLPLLQFVQFTKSHTQRLVSSWSHAFQAVSQSAVQAGLA